jgi:hypothetical protein
MLTSRSSSWKRFSTAVHMADVPGDVEKGPQKSGKTSVDTKYVYPRVYERQGERGILTSDGRDEWLAQQHKEKRRCRILCASITGIVLLVIIAAAIVGWYFTNVRKI